MDKGKKKDYYAHLEVEDDILELVELVGPSVQDGCDGNQSPRPERSSTAC